MKRERLHFTGLGGEEWPKRGPSTGSGTCRLGPPTLDRVGRAGHGRHGGEAPALRGGPMMSALILWSFPIKRKGRNNKDGSSKHRSHAYPQSSAGMTCSAEPGETQRIFLCALACFWKSCNFAGRNKPGIRYDLPKVRAVAYRFSTTYLLHSAACYNKPRADLQTNKSG